LFAQVLCGTLYSKVRGEMANSSLTNIAVEIEKCCEPWAQLGGYRYCKK
jgi:hypothetical protein